MGRTDKYVIPVYNKILNQYKERKIAFFGSTPKDKMSSKFVDADFYDYQLGNWDINGKWNLKTHYELIACLRTSGFSRNPHEMLNNFNECLCTKGILFIDWGMGSDHWRRDCLGWTWGWKKLKFRCYGIYRRKKHYLYSSCLTNSMLLSKAYKKICNYSKSVYGNRKCEEIIKEEFQTYLICDNDIDSGFHVLNETVWTPIDFNGRSQLYIIHVLEKK